MTHLGRTLTLVLGLLTGSAVACKQSAERVPASTEPASPGLAAPDPARARADDELAKPALTDDKIQRYLKSLAPGSTLFEVPTAGRTLQTRLAASEAQEAFARQHGFASAAEYIDTLGRITLGEAQLAADVTVAGMRASAVQVIADTEKQLAVPELAAADRAAANEILAEAKRHLADLNDPDATSTGLNAGDLALVKKYQAELAAATKTTQ